MTAAHVADEYDALMAQVIAVADGCSPADWTTNCANERRPVGVMFDHIAEINADVVRWVQEFLSGRPVELTREMITQRNAEHARKAVTRPREETLRDLKAGSERTSEFIRALTAEQLAVTQEWGWAGTQTVGWVARVAILHPTSHLKSIKEALSRSGVDESRS
jgi:DinB superfamily